MTVRIVSDDLHCLTMYSTVTVVKLIFTIIVYISIPIIHFDNLLKAAQITACSLQGYPIDVYNKFRLFV